ncbi:MAG TPA: hypothetical protein VM488_12980, partial [Pseudobacter sp.]|nr:hypothetical protein [Pseudobacter sp.]
VMTKKQWEKFLKELPEDPLEDIGILGWQRNYTPAEWKETTKEIGEAIRKDREKRMKETMQLAEQNDSIAKVS